MSEFIEISGAKTNNLKNIDLKIPKNKITVITGPSGAGKSSLAFQTIYSEGNRKYLESVSANLRFLLDTEISSSVNSIKGLSPTLAIRSRSQFHPLSTAGSVTDIEHYVKVLFSSLGVPHCHICGKELAAFSVSKIIALSEQWEEGCKIIVLSPFSWSSGEELEQLKEKFLAQGFVRVRFQGKYLGISEFETEEQSGKFELVIDRLKKKEGSQGRLQEALESAYGIQESLVLELNGEDFRFSEKFICHDHDVVVESLSLKQFSNKRSENFCRDCEGTGYINQGVEGEEPIICPSCGGKKYSPEVLSIKLLGKNVADFMNFNFEELLQNLNLIDSKYLQLAVIKDCVEQIRTRIELLKKLGIHYLTPGRGVQTLSEGELQRAQIVGQLASGLSGVIYVIDEISSALHPRDIKNVLQILKQLQSDNNTLILVDHHPMILSQADYWVVLGPDSGEGGGEVLYQGPPQQYSNAPFNIKAYLSPSFSQSPKGASLPVTVSLLGAKGNNLNDVHISLLQGVNVICGPSGSGKSSLLIQTLGYVLRNSLNRSKHTPLPFEAIEGIENFQKAILITQGAFARSNKSNLATISGVFDTIRNLFSKVPDAKVKGFKAGRFSYNIKGGRCEVCKGEGFERLELANLLDSGITCSACNGTRYNAETLKILFKGKNIAEVLSMDVCEALSFFRDIPKIRSVLTSLESLGLGYLRLGQPSSQYSTGELRRLSLGVELSKVSTQNNIIILDEPSRGLFLTDLKLLKNFLFELKQKGNTLAIIDHHPEILAIADNLIAMECNSSLKAETKYQGPVEKFPGIAEFLT